MKKIAIAIAIMLAFSAFAMAGDIVVSGDATTTFGYNLDTESYGLLSEVGSDVSFTVGEADAESMGEGEWYGVIELTGASIAWGSGMAEADGAVWYWATTWNEDEEMTQFDFDGTEEFIPAPFAVIAPDVTARITNGNQYAMLQTEAEFVTDYVVGVEDDAAEYAAPAYAGSWTFGGMFDPATVAVEFATAGSYEDPAQVDGVVLGAVLGLDVAPLTVDVAFGGAFGYATVDNDMAFAVQVAADVAPATVTAAFDYLMPEVGDATYEAGVAVSADLAPLTVGLDVYYGVDASDVAGEEDVDVAVSAGFADDAMTVDFTFGAYDLSAATLVWDTSLDLTYAVSSGVAFAAGMVYDSAETLGAYANVALTEVVDNVTFTLAWADAEDITDNLAVDPDFVDLGTITFATMIEY